MAKAHVKNISPNHSPLCLFLPEYARFVEIMSVLCLCLCYIYIISTHSCIRTFIRTLSTLYLHYAKLYRAIPGHTESYRAKVQVLSNHIHCVCYILYLISITITFAIAIALATANPHPIDYKSQLDLIR